MKAYLFFALILIFAAADGFYYYRNYYHKHLTFERTDYPAIDVVFKEGAGLGIRTDIREVKSWAAKNGVTCSLAFYEFEAPAKDMSEMKTRRGCITDGLATVKPPLQYEHIKKQNYLIGTMMAKRPKHLDQQFDEVKAYLALHKDSMQKVGGAIVVFNIDPTLFDQPFFKILTPVADARAVSAAKEVNEKK